MFVKITDSFAVDRDSILAAAVVARDQMWVINIKLQYTHDNYQLGPFDTLQEARNNLNELVRMINTTPKEN